MRSIIDNSPTVNQEHLKRYMVNFVVNTKESVLSVCDKPYHTNKKKNRKGRRLTFHGTVHFRCG